MERRKRDKQERSEANDDCVMLMSNAFWKCLLSKSNIARAKPHKKNNEVMSTNGTKYCRLVNVAFFISNG